MAQDADRFRPREPAPANEGSIAEQTPPSAPSATGASDRGTLPSAPAQRPQGGSAPQQEGQGGGRSAYAQSRAGQQYGRPQLGQPQVGGTQYARPSRLYAPPAAAQRYADPQGDERGAPLIHPAAAQAGSTLPYGVPVYRAPVYAYAPQPQRGLSITALVLGLCSAVFAWTMVVVPLIGLVFGFLALRREPAGKGMAVTGLITSGVGLLWILLFYVLPLVGVVTALFGMRFA